MPSQQTALLTLLTAGSDVLSSPLSSPELLERQSCPDIHVFGARETTARPGASAEAIDLPASGDDPTYSQSVAAGTSVRAQRSPTTPSAAAATQNHGVSSICSIASYNVAAAIFMGDPRSRAGARYNVGTCAAYGGSCPPRTLDTPPLPNSSLRTELTEAPCDAKFDARPAGQYCGAYNGNVRSYCDATDPYCCTGGDADTHQSYARVYGSQALAFVDGRLASSSGGGGDDGEGGDGGGSYTTTTASNPGPTGGGSVPELGQCSGSNTCAPGLMCGFETVLLAVPAEVRGSACGCQWERKRHGMRRSPLTIVRAVDEYAAR